MGGKASLPIYLKIAEMHEKRSFSRVTRFLIRVRFVAKRADRIHR